MSTQKQRKPRAPRLPQEEFNALRQHFIEKGGVLFHKSCPRDVCHSAVVRYDDGQAVACLTCGWFRQVTDWGSKESVVTPQQVVAGSQSEFRALALLVDPNRWQHLIQKAKKRGDVETAKFFTELTARISTADVHDAPSPAVERHRTASTPAAQQPAAPGLSPRQIPKLGSDAPVVVIYTDGGCEPNPGPGGWAAILWAEGAELELAGGHRETTNNRMEMTAALEGLKALRRPSRVTVVTDSQYLMNGMTDWMTAWSKRKWTRKGEPLANPDLWEALAREALKHESYWSWTRGHIGQPENERCDELAGLMIGRRDIDREIIAHRERQDRAGPLPKLEKKPTATVWLRD